MKHDLDPHRPCTPGARLSCAQEQAWFIGQLVPDTIAYHFQARIRIRGALDVAVLEGALAVIIERHESLRTVFVEHDGAPYQIIQAPWRPSIPVVDLSGLPDSMRGGYVDVLIDAELRKRIDVSKLPLVRCTAQLLWRQTRRCAPSRCAICDGGMLTFSRKS